MDQSTPDTSPNATQTDQSLGIVLDGRLVAPFYRQIVDQVAARITSGDFPPGFRLPPSRALATALDTHRNTVVRAFEELAQDGYIAGHVGRGSFVLDRSEGRRARRARSSEDDGPVSLGGRPVDRTLLVEEPKAIYRADTGIPWQSLLSRAVESEPLQRMQRLSAGGIFGDVVNLSRMQASLDLLPHQDFRACMDHVLATLGPEALGYAPGQGLERLRVLVAGELGHSGIAVSADDILITTGSQQALDLVARALVDPGDAFLTEGRTYSGALNILTACGADVIGVPGDDEGPDMRTLRALGRRRPKGLYLMPSSRNPTGTSISEPRRKALVDWSQEAGIPLVEDDYGADLELEPGTTLASLRSLDSDVFHVGTYSKKLIPALRVGFIVCPPTMRGPLTRLKHAMDLGTSTLLQHALAEFLERGLLQAHLARVTSAYRQRRDALAAALRESLPEEVTFKLPDRGVVLWLSLPPGVDPEIAYEAARLEGVLVSPGSVYTVTDATGPAPGRVPSPAGLRLTYCSEPAERLVEGAHRLGRALKKVLSRRHVARQVELMGA